MKSYSAALMSILGFLILVDVAAVKNASESLSSTFDRLYLTIPIILTVIVWALAAYCMDRDNRRRR